VEEKVPPFLKGTGKGWVRAEYSMLPCSVPARVHRDVMKTSGRSSEIQRLIGRALRGVVELSALGERTVLVDCDVIQADGGTRCASITGGFVSLYLLVKKLYAEKMIKEFPIKEFVAAISCGMVEKETMLDLDYNEDSSASCDINVVMTENRKVVEIQGTAETEPFDVKTLCALIELAWGGIKELVLLQKKALGVF
jgi:ribonuclease PH